jgi:hypothetical protein
MSIRSLDLLDLPVIARYRNDVLTLDSARALTRGHPLGAVGLLAYVNPARHLYAAIANGGETALLGGVIHTRGDSFAKLLYLAPASNLNHDQLPALLEHLAAQAGGWNAFHVLAEVDETSNIFPALRMAGFSVYAWQRLWDVSQIEKTGSTLPVENARGVSGWRRTQSVDLPGVQNLHYQIVPPLLHPIEPAPNRALGFVCPEQTKCYASVTAGMYGVVVTPFIHPDEQNVSEKIAALVTNLPDRRGRKIYLCVRSYQAWLEPVLEDLGAQALPRQAVMVKHLTRMIKAEQAVRAVPSNVTVQPSRVSRMKIDE